MIDTVDTIIDLGMLKDGMKVADIGCGSGNWALDFIERGLDIDYVGVDCQTLCRREFEERVNHPRYKMYLLNIGSRLYNPTGLIQAKEVEFPIESSSQDLVICHSLFTHLGRYANAVRYIEEIRRILKPSGFLWITFFLSPPNEPDYRTQRSVYTALEVEKLISPFTKLYSNGGESTGYNDQRMYGLRYDGV